MKHLHPIRPVATLMPLAGVGIVVLALALAGCAPTLKLVADTLDIEVVPETVQQQAYKAASIAFTAWSGPACDVDHDGVPDAVQDCPAGGLQKAMLIVGRAPRCSATVKGPICVPQKVWDKIKEIELKTSSTLQAAKPIIESGTDDVALLMSIPAAVYDAQRAFNDAQSGKE